jgi:hypothetical protein
MIDLLVPFIDGMVMNQDRLNFNRPQKTWVVHGTIVYVECNKGIFRCDVAKRDDN